MLETIIICFTSCTTYRVLLEKKNVRTCNNTTSSEPRGTNGDLDFGLGIFVTRKNDEGGELIGQGPWNIRFLRIYR